MAGKSLFQTFLIGQQQLGERLALPEMEQLRQRIVATYQLKSLNIEETKDYILFRLKKAGWNNSPQFEDEVFTEICNYTKGIPRLINTLCDRVLLFGYLDELTIIDSLAVKKVIEDIEEESSLITDEFHAIKASTIVNIDSNSSYEDRLVFLEKMVRHLQDSVSKERTLLRKAILLQLDMDNVYNENL
jgi:hypothetical protein